RTRSRRRRRSLWRAASLSSVVAADEHEVRGPDGVGAGRGRLSLLFDLAPLGGAGQQLAARSLEQQQAEARGREQDVAGFGDHGISPPRKSRPRSRCWPSAWSRKLRGGPG